MNEKEKLTALNKWASSYQRIEENFDKLHVLLGVSPESPVLTDVHRMFDSYTETLAELLGDREGWLEWYYLENKMGEFGLEAKSSSQKQLRPTKGTVELLNLILDQEPEENKETQ